jgi:hypothetical protein
MTTMFRVLKTTELNKRHEEHSQEASHDAFILRLPPTPAPSQAGSLQATHPQRHYLEQQIIARLSILILSKTYTSVITTSPTVDMKGFLAAGVSLAEKQQRVCPYFQVLAQVLVDYSFLS